jgi:hypothetical protein
MYIVRMGRFSCGLATTPLTDPLPTPLIGIPAFSKALGKGSFINWLSSVNVGQYRRIPVQLLAGELVSAYGIC